MSITHEQLIEAGWTTHVDHGWYVKGSFKFYPANGWLDLYDFLDVEDSAELEYVTGHLEETLAALYPNKQALGH